MHDDDTHSSVSRVYKTVLHHHILRFCLSPEHTKYIFNCLYFTPRGLGARKMTAGAEKRERVPCVCDVIRY